MIGDRPCDGLSYPPCRIGGKFETERRIKFLHGSHQTEIPLLNEIGKRKTAIYVPFCNGNGKAKVRFDHPTLCITVARGCGGSKALFFFCSQQCELSALMQIQPKRITEYRAFQFLLRFGQFGIGYFLYGIQCIRVRLLLHFGFPIPMLRGRVFCHFVPPCLSLRSLYSNYIILVMLLCKLNVHLT